MNAKFTPRLSRWIAGSIRQSIVKNFRYAQPKMRSLALFGVLGEPFFYWYWRTIDENAYESLEIRISAALLCVPLLLTSQKRREKNEFAYAVYYIATATFCFPFCFGYLLLMNIDQIAIDALAAVQWPMQYAVALVLLVLLFPIGPIATIQFLLGSLCAWLLFIASRDELALSEQILHVAWELLPVYVFILLAGSVFNRNREIIDQEKLAAVASVGTTIAHELRTPFLGMRALVEGIEKYIPTLMRTYDLAVENGLPVERIRLSHVRGLNRSLERIRDEIDYSSAVVDMLLVNSSEHPVKESEFTTFSAAACVRESIVRYPFTSAEEGRLVKTELSNDFSIRAPQLLIVHVLFNLLKNAVYYVRKAGHGDVCIRLEPADDFNRMIVEDTGTGIPPENLKRIFERFFTTTETGHGAGIGLSFCQIVMSGVGGSIRCDSEFGAFTRFTLEFPRVVHHG